MAQGARIRAARADDEDQISQVHARCIGDVFNGRYFPPEAERAAAQLRWSGPVGAPLARHALLVAELAGALVGFTAVGPTRDAGEDPTTAGELRVILVDVRVRGTGVGAALIGAGERGMRSSGFSVATLWVLPDNEPAVRCYARCGWRPDGAERVGDFGGEEVHSVRYSKQLGR